MPPFEKMNRERMYALKKEQFGSKNYRPTLGQDFIYLSSMTQGHTGKTVKVALSAVKQFIMLVDIKSYDGQAVIRSLEFLTANAGHLGSIPNNSSAKNYMLHTRNVRVFYEISQSEQGKPTAVYIKNVQPAYAEKIKGEVFRVTGGTGTGLSIKETTLKDNKLLDNDVYINGQVSDLKELLKKCNTDNPSKTGTTVVYNPSSAVNELGIWKSRNQSTNTDKSVDILRDILQANQNRSVTWRVEGEGINLLNSAMRNANASLKNYTFQFIAPIGDTPSLITHLKKNKANLPQELIRYPKHAVSNKMAQATLLAYKPSLDAIFHGKGSISSHTEYSAISTKAEQLNARYLTKNNKTTKTLVDILRMC